MEHVEHVLFRPAVGGFHRKDVMDYLELLAQEHGEALEACREERNAARNEAHRLEAVLTQTKAVVEALEAQRTKATAACEEARRTADSAQLRLCEMEQAAKQAQAALETERTAREAAQSALEARQAEAEALSAQVEAYLALKDRLSGIELSAHQRAAEVERMAELEAENIQRKAREKVLSLHMQYELAVRALEAGRRQMTEQLCDMQMALDALAPVLEQAGKTLVSLCEDRGRFPEEEASPRQPPAPEDRPEEAEGAQPQARGDRPEKAGRRA